MLFGSAVAIVASLVTAEELPAAVVAGLSVAVAIASIVLVRNPIYTGMAAHTVAHVRLTPTPTAMVAVLLMVVGVELRVRSVEEPDLDRVRRDTYRAWTPDEWPLRPPSRLIPARITRRSVRIDLEKRRPDVDAEVAIARESIDR